jgi:hypothetical protein
MEEGTFVSAPPPKSSGYKSDYDWDGMARKAMTRPGVALLAYKDVPVSRIKSVRGYNRPPFIQNNGRIRIESRTRVDDNGVRVGDIYFTWVPNQPED